MTSRGKVQSARVAAAIAAAGPGAVIDLADALTVRCPTCGAPAGQPCTEPAAGATVHTITVPAAPGDQRDAA